MYRNTLFVKDTHSTNENQFSKIYGSEESLIRSLLKKYYSLKMSKDFEVKKFSGANLNSNNYKIGSFYFKTISNANFAKRFAFFSNLSNCLRKSNLPYTNFLQNDYGEVISKISKNGNTMYFCLQNFIEGDFFSGKNGELLLMLTVLKKLENCFLEITPGCVHGEPYLFWKPQTLLKKVKKILRSKEKADILTIFDKDVLAVMTKLFEICSFYRRNRDKLNFQNLHHYDLHPHNLLFKSNNLVAILDLDNIGQIDTRIATGFNLYKLGRKAIANHCISIDEFKMLANNYFNLKYLKDFALIELLQRFCLLFNEHYILKMDSRDNELEKYIRGLDEIEVMFQ